MRRISFIFGSFLVFTLAQYVKGSVYNLRSLFAFEDNDDHKIMEVDHLGDCISGYFKCNDTTQCIPQNKNCDGSVDCDDESDEFNCGDDNLNKYIDHLFRKRPAAKLDDMPHGSCAWPKFNKTCICRDREILCEFLSLDSVPPTLHTADVSEVVLFDLTGNSFPLIDASFFNNLPLDTKTLVLRHCSISQIAENAFHKLSNFTLELFLDNNRLKFLPDILFPSRADLKILVLANNQIEELQDTVFVNLDNLQELDLRHNNIEMFNEELFQPLQSLIYLYLNDNRIKQIVPGMLPSLKSLMSLSLANNQIKFIKPDSFHFPMLRNIYLSDNKLESIENGTFQHSPILSGLNLNDNHIKHLQVGAFDGITNLTSLYLEGNQFSKLNGEVLDDLTSLTHIYFSSFHLCKAAPHVRVCEPKTDGISSNRHLLDNPILRGSVWIMAVIGIFGNLLVLFGRFVSGKRNTQAHAEHSLYLRHLAGSDLLMGIYLAVIASADIMFRGEYLQHEESWRHSYICDLCGFLSTLSCQSSTFLLTLVTWDRLISVIRPLQPRSSNKCRAVLRLTCLWCLAIAGAAAPLSGTEYFGKYFYGSNGVCLSIHIHDPYAKGWEYSAGMFILLNTLSVLFIVISYLRMLRAIRGSGEALRSTLSGRENAVARRFAIIVATDCACWLPIIVVKLAALARVQISPALYAWIAVLILPVNSALNPVLYTLTTAQFKQQMSRFIYSLPCGAAEPNGYESALSVSLGYVPNNRKRLGSLHCQSHLKLHF